MFSVLFIRGSFSALNCAYLMSRYLVIFGAYVLWSLGIFSVLKMPVNFKPVSQDSGNFQQPNICPCIKIYILLFSKSSSESLFYILCSSLQWQRNYVLFTFSTVTDIKMQCTPKCNSLQSSILFCASSFLTIAISL